MLLQVLILATIGSALTAPCQDCEAFCECAQVGARSADISLAQVQTAYVKCLKKYRSRTNTTTEIDFEGNSSCQIPKCNCMEALYKMLNYEGNEKHGIYFGDGESTMTTAEKKIERCVTKQLKLSDAAFDKLKLQYEHIQDSLEFCFLEECGVTIDGLVNVTNNCAMKNGLMDSKNLSEGKDLVEPDLAFDQRPFGRIPRFLRRELRRELFFSRFGDRDDRFFRRIGRNRFFGRRGRRGRDRFRHIFEGRGRFGRRDRSRLDRRFNGRFERERFGLDRFGDIRDRNLDRKRGRDRGRIDNRGFDSSRFDGRSGRKFGRERSDRGGSQFDNDPNRNRDRNSNSDQDNRNRRGNIDGRGRRREN